MVFLHQGYIKKAKKVVEKGRLNVLKLHKALGVPIVTEKDGKIIEVPADEKQDNEEVLTTILLV